MSFSVRVVGVGDAFTARYYNACLLLESGDTRLLVDAPPALARALRALGEHADPTGRAAEVVGLDDIDNVLITHLHGDHCGGLEQLLFWRRFVTNRKCNLYAIPAVLAEIWSTRLKGGMDTLMDASGARTTLGLEDYAVIHALDPRGSRCGGMHLEWRPTIHHIPTSALRVTAGGRTVGYSADTSFDPGLIEWLAASELFFHETNVGVHTPLASLVALPATVRERMRLIHYPDYHDVDSSPIGCAREGDRFEV